VRHQQKEEQEAEIGKKTTTTTNEVFLREDLIILHMKYIMNEIYSQVLMWMVL
jgi:hypothetical protein